MPRRPVETYNELPHTAALIVALIFFWSDAKSHEATTGWHYPMRCCGEGDCGHATSAVRNPDGSLTVTTQHGQPVYFETVAHIVPETA